MPRRLLFSTVLIAFLFLPMTSCATIAGTAVSPITGGVSLAKRNVHRDNWYMAPVYFIGGVVAGPFVAFYNGVNHDAGIFRSFTRYWTEFELVFRPFDMILLK